MNYDSDEKLGCLKIFQNRCVICDKLPLSWHPWIRHYWISRNVEKIIYHLYRKCSPEDSGSISGRGSNRELICYVFLTSNPVKMWANTILTALELTWIISRWADFEDTQLTVNSQDELTLWAFREFATHTVSSLHGELIRMTSQIAHSKLTVWVANSPQACVSHMCESHVWGNWASSKMSQHEFQCELPVSWLWAEILHWAVFLLFFFLEGGGFIMSYLYVVFSPSFRFASLPNFKKIMF